LQTLATDEAVSPLSHLGDVDTLAILGENEADPRAAIDHVPAVGIMDESAVGARDVVGRKEDVVVCVAAERDGPRIGELADLKDALARSNG